MHSGKYFQRNQFWEKLVCEKLIAPLNRTSSASTVITCMECQYIALKNAIGLSGQK